MSDPDADLEAALLSFKRGNITINEVKRTIDKQKKEAIIHRLNQYLEYTHEQIREGKNINAIALRGMIKDDIDILINMMRRPL